MKKVVSKIFLDHIALVSAADNEVIDTVVAVDLKDVPISFPPILPSALAANGFPPPDGNLVLQQDHSLQTGGTAGAKAFIRSLWGAVREGLKVGDFVELTSALDDYSKKDIAGEDNHTWSSNTVILEESGNKTFDD